MNILDLIGNTPVIKLRGFDTGLCEIFIKLESQNPGGSIKDRIALSMIRRAEARGDIKPGATLVEATAGNTGLGLALVASQLGYKLILVIPDKMSREKVRHLQAMGAEIVTTRSDVQKGHPDYYHDRAQALAASIPGSYYVNQFGNTDNPLAHQEGTGPEIWKQMEGKLDAIVCGVGSGGTITGLNNFFINVAPNLELVLADPVGSILAHYIKTGEVLKESGSWVVEGIGEDFLPSILDLSRVRSAYSISDQDSLDTARELLKTNGIMAGSSSGTLLAAALRYAREQKVAKRILTFACDSGNKYLSKQFNNVWMKEQGFLKSPKYGDIRDMVATTFDSSSLTYVKPDETLMIAFQRMKSEDVSQLPVLDQSKVVGIIDGSDILPSVYSDRHNFKKLVKEVMVTKLEVLEHTDSVSKVVDLLQRGYVPIVTVDQKFYGFITRTDLLNYLKSSL
jgi:cystathionine beta-synthase